MDSSSSNTLYSKKRLTVDVLFITTKNVIPINAESGGITLNKVSVLRDHDDIKKKVVDWVYKNEQAETVKLGFITLKITSTAASPPNVTSRNSTVSSDAAVIESRPPVL